MIKKTTGLILPLIISAIAGCGEGNSANTEGNVVEIINEDQALIINIDNNTTSFDVLAKASNGVVTYNNSTKKVTYQPNENYFGEDSFKINYGTSDNKNSISYSLTINSVNDAPVILSNEVVTREYHSIGQTWEYKIKTSDVEDDGVYYNPLEKEDNPNKSLVLFEFNDLEKDVDVEPEDVIVRYGEFSYNQSTQILTHVTSQDKEDYSHTAKVTIIDSEGLETVKDITFEIDYINEAPEYDGVVAFNILEDEVLTIDLKTTVSDPDGDDYVLSINTDGLVGVINNTDDVLEYTPPSSFFGQDAFEFTVTDDFGASITRTIDISVERVISSLVVDSFAETILEDGSYSVQVTYTDNENIPEDDIVFSIKSSSSKGATNMTPDGLVSYEPFLNENGVDQIVITVSDNLGRSKDSIIDVTITPVNDVVQKTQDLEFQTLGNIHFEGNISSYFQDIDGDDITFTQGTLNDINSSSTLEVETSGAISYTPEVGKKDYDSYFDIEVTDGTEEVLYTLHVSVEDELVKIIDNQATDSSNVGSALNPYTDITTAASELTDGDNLYFCANDIDVDGIIEIPENVSLIGINNGENHDFVEYCEVQTGTETNLTILDISEIQLNTNNILENFKIVNESSSPVLTSNKTNVDNITLKNMNISQVNFAHFAYLESVNGLTIEDVILFNGDNGIVLDKIAGDVVISRLTVESVKNVLEIKDLSKDTILSISESVIDDFEKAITIANTITSSEIDINILSSTLESVIEDSVAVDVNVRLSSSSILLDDLIVTADNPVSLITNNSNDVSSSVTNSELKNSKGTSLVIKNLGAEKVEVLVGDNVFDVVKDLAPLNMIPYIDIEQSSLAVGSTLIANLENNLLNNTNNSNLNSGNAINININAEVGDVSSFINAINNTVQDPNIDHLKIDFSAEDSVVEASPSKNVANINVLSNQFQSAIMPAKSLFLNAAGMKSSCVNVENNRLAKIDLKNPEVPGITSDIDLYDPQRVGISNVITSRNIEVGEIEIQGYDVKTDSACLTKPAPPAP
jgi:hypothetical protein